MLVTMSSLSVGDIMGRLKFDLVELVHTCHCILEEVELHPFREMITNGKHIFISAQFVAPIQDESMCCATPL